MINEYAIGLFDSGVGGLSVLKEVVDLLPNENIIYYGDNYNAPYGERTKQNIQELCIKIVDFLINKKCKAIVIACNTATAAAYDIIKEKYNIPVIGVIFPGAKSAVITTKNNKVGVLATPFTVNSNVYAKKIGDISKDIEVYQEGCSEFCPMIESGWEGYENRMDLLKGHISKLPKDIDTLVLGCTHYPIITKDIESVFAGKIVDPARETTLELKNVLEKNNIKSDSQKKGKLEFYVSGDTKKFKNVAIKFLGFSIDNVAQNKL
ncbi:MAG: glutamate racemase [Fusobacteriaceae bacterium]|jgi:glutamate racemase|nr:glutamate racemase [Fusobacteriaceae bacterium]